MALSSDFLGMPIKPTETLINIDTLKIHPEALCSPLAADLSLDADLLSWDRTSMLFDDQVLEQSIPYPETARNPFDARKVSFFERPNRNTFRP
jgi:hypothetical protein